MPSPRLLVLTAATSLLVSCLAWTQESTSGVVTFQRDDPAAHIHLDQYPSHLPAYLPRSEVTILQSDGYPLDTTCYLIRSYLMVRDSPHSDTTHRDGYSTCVPAARVRMYSTVERGR